MGCTGDLAAASFTIVLHYTIQRHLKTSYQNHACIKKPPFPFSLFHNRLPHFYAYLNDSDHTKYASLTKHPVYAPRPSLRAETDHSRQL